MFFNTLFLSAFFSCFGVMLQASSLIQIDIGGMWTAVTVNGLVPVIQGDKAGSLPYTPGWGVDFSLSGQLPSEMCLGVTALLSKAHQNQSYAGNHLLSTWDVSPLSYIQTADAHYRLHLGILGCQLDKAIECTPSFVFRPSLGIVYASIRQKYFFSASSGAEQVDWLNKNKYWGIGPEGGAEIEWRCFKRFSIKMYGGIACLYGLFYLHEEKKLQSESLTAVNFLDSFRLGTQMVKSALSLCGYLDKSQRVSIELGCEEMLFFAQNQLRRFTSASSGISIGNQGDISLLAIRGAIQCSF
ncbi:MAG: Legionella pneumophila major outer membrane protein precursor [Chlamydiota bacterium]|jgi:hypothetical protein